MVAREVQVRRQGQQGRLVQEGEYWTMELGESVARFRDSRGMQYLANLLARPHVAVSTAALVSAANRPDRSGTELAASTGSNEVPGYRYATETERVAVTRALRAAIQRIAQHHTGLGTHLNQSIRTGRQCVYAPDSAQLIRWRVRSASSNGSVGVG